MERPKLSASNNEPNEIESCKTSDLEDLKFDLMKRSTDLFLINAGAVPTTPELYAAWLAVYISQEGDDKVRHHDRNLERPKSSRYVDIWTPTKPFDGIPIAYGANSTNLLVIPYMSGDSTFTPTGYYPYKSNRSGRVDYGHTNVMKLDIDRTILGNVELSASTTERDRIESYEDVDRLLQDESRFSVKALSRSIANGSLFGVQSITKKREVVPIPPSSDLFGLEQKASDPVAEYGRTMFTNASKLILGYIATNNNLIAAFRNPDVAVTLPDITTDHMSGSLSFASFPNGSNVIHLDGNRREDSNRAGFLLVQTSDGEMTIVGSDLEKSWAANDMEYSKYVEQAVWYINHYFDALKVSASANIITGSSIHEMRGQLGAMTVRKTKKRLAAAIEE